MILGWAISAAHAGARDGTFSDHGCHSEGTRGQDSPGTNKLTSLTEARRAVPCQGRNGVHGIESVLRQGIGADAA